MQTTIKCPGFNQALTTCPSASILAVLNCNAVIAKDITNFVCGAPVFVLFSRGAHVHDQVEQGFGFACVSFCTSSCAFGLQAQHASQEGVKRAFQRGDVFGAQRHATCRGAVDGLHAVEERGNQSRRVEVVVHRGVALFGKGLDVVPGFTRGGLKACEGFHSFFQLRQALFRGLQRFVAEVECAGVVAHEHEEAHRHGGVALVEEFVVAGDEFFRRESVAFRLGHFAAVDGEHVSVHPVANGTFAAVGADVLGNFTLVVGELEVHAAAVNVKRLAEVLGAHHGALEVPPGETHAPGGGPLHKVACVRSLPKGEVERVSLFALAVEVTRVVHQLVNLAARQLSVRMVFAEFPNAEVHAAVDFVRISVVDDFFDGLDLLDNVTRCGGLNRRTKDVEHVHHVVEVVGVALHHFHWLEVFKTCLLANLVLAVVRVASQVADVGDIAHVAHLEPEVLQVAVYDVEGQNVLTFPKCTLL